MPFNLNQDMKNLYSKCKKIRKNTYFFVGFQISGDAMELRCNLSVINFFTCLIGNPIKTMIFALKIAKNI